MKNWMRSIVLFFVCLTVWACNNDSASSLKSTSLMSYGIATNVLAPEGASIKQGLTGIIDEVTITGENEYILEVQSSEALAETTQQAISDAKGQIQSGAYFSKIVKEDDTGFIYEIAVDSSHVSYNFYKVIVQGTKEIIFKLPANKPFGKEKAEWMFSHIWEDKK